MSNLYDEREQYLKMKEQMRDSMKLRAKRKGKYIKQGSVWTRDLYLEDQYLRMYEDQQRVRRAIYKMVISALFMIVFGIVLGVLVYSL